MPRDTLARRMLAQLRVKNFRLLRAVEIEFDDLTVLVGPNASGKSTVLEVLDFVTRCAMEGLQQAATAHGGFDGLPRRARRQLASVRPAQTRLASAACPWQAPS